MGCNVIEIHSENYSFIMNNIAMTCKKSHNTIMYVGELSQFCVFLF